MMGVIAKYKFNPSVYADYLPNFNAGFTGYTKTDVNNGDGTITRTISHNTLKPTRIQFGTGGGVSDRERSLLEVIECDTSQVTDMTRMFQNCQSLTLLNSSSFDTSNVTTMHGMFIACGKLTSINLSSFNTSNVTSMNAMFNSCKSLTSINLSNFNTSKVTDMGAMFKACTKLTSIDLSSFNASNVTNMSQMFYDCYSLVSLNMSNLSSNKLTSIGEMFRNCGKLTSLDLSNFNTSQVNNMGAMFGGCTSLTSLDLSNFDTNKVDNMAIMFQECSSLTSLDLSNFDTSNVTSMSGMFQYCSSLTSLDLSSFDTSKVTNMGGMFQSCSSLTSLDLSPFNTISVTNMQGMFEKCTSLTSLDLSNFNTSKVTNMSYMFHRLTLKEIDINSFTTESLTNCGSLFRDSRVEKIDMSNFKYKDGMNIGSMFYWCNKLEMVGTLFCDTNTVNKIVEVLRNDKPEHEIVSFYYHDANEAELNPINSGTVFVKYEFPTTISLPPHISLYSLPDGTRDELDIKTGVLTRHVGKFILDGSFASSWKKVESNNESTIFERSKATGEPNFLTLIKNYGFPSTLNNSNAIVNVHIGANLKKYPSLTMDTYFGNYYIKIAIPNKAVNDLDSDGYSNNDVNSWLNENPIKILYKLSTSTTEKLILNYNHSCDYGMVLPKGAVDRYDVLTGQYNQNIASIELNGADAWHSIEEFNKCVKIGLEGVHALGIKAGGGLYCDNDLFPNIDDNSDVEHCVVDPTTGSRFYFYIDKNRLSSPDLIGWQIWLQQNPFTMYYELAETKVLDKSYEELDPELARWEMMDSVKEGTISYTSNNDDNLTLYPNMTYVAPSVNNFDVEVLEPNTTYTVYAENVVGGLNLGGNTSNFTSGTTFTSGENKWLTFNSSPDVENIMLIKGDTTDEVVPYFNGTESVRVPSVVTAKDNKMSILSTSSDVILRSNGNVKDEYNAKTGELTQRISESGEILSQEIIKQIDFNIEYKESDKKYLVDVFEGTTNINVSSDVSPSIVDIAYFTNEDTLATITTDSATVTDAKADTYIQRAILKGNTGYRDIDTGEFLETFEEGRNLELVSVKMPVLTTSNEDGTKTNILTVNEPVELRGIGEVQDTLDLMTGEVTQRVGKTTITGDMFPNLVSWGRNNNTETMCFENFNNVIPFAWNQVISADWPISWEGFSPALTHEYFNPYDGHGIFRIKRSRLETEDENGFRKWLNENPITIYHPIIGSESIKTVDLTLTKQGIDELQIKQLPAYENGQILLSSESGMLPTMIYSLPSSNAFRLPSMRTGTRYTLKYPSASGSIGIGEINYKITGPSMLFTTPLTIKGDTSSIVFTDDDPQDVMLIEGDYSKREIPFFTGMRSSENIVITTRKDDANHTVQTQTTLRALPNGAADKLDLVSGQLLRVTGIRDYQEGDLLNRDVFTDQVKTVYPLSTPTVTTINPLNPMAYAEGNVELASDALIPTLHYRLLSSNNFVLELLKPETRYTLYANYEQSGSFTLGGTLTQSIGNAKTFTTANNLTDSYLTFDGDLGLSNVMLIEGDSRELTVPYFNGLLSVENATVKVNGSLTEVNRVVLPNTIKLRSLDSLIDELDLITGVYTKRIESKRLTGNESWQLGAIDTKQYISFKLVCEELKAATLTNLYCDRFNSLAWTSLTDQAFEFVTGSGTIEINIRKDRLTTPNIAGFKRWLSQYPTTVHYELAQPNITTLTLPWSSKPVSSFYGSTTIQTSVSQSLKPYLQVIIATTTLEDIVSDLKEKNASLEEENLSTMMAVTEVFEMIMYIMPSEATTINIGAPMKARHTNERGGFQMVEVYVTLIIKGKKTLEQVPAIIRPQVKAQLIELGVIEA